MNIGVVLVPDFDDIYDWLVWAFDGSMGGSRDRYGMYTGGYAIDRSAVVRFGDFTSYFAAGDEYNTPVPMPNIATYDLYELPSGLYNDADLVGWQVTYRQAIRDCRMVKRRLQRVVRKALIKFPTPCPTPRDLRWPERHVASRCRRRMRKKILNYAADQMRTLDFWIDCLRDFADDLPISVRETDVGSGPATPSSPNDVQDVTLPLLSSP